MQNNNEESSVEKMSQSVVDHTDAASDIESTNTEIVDDEKEEQYEKAVKFMKSLKCMTPSKDKAMYYKEVAQQFLDLSGYKESETYAKKCKRNAKKVKEEIKKELYEKALHLKNTAKTPEEYVNAAKLFRKAKGYLDAEEKATECEVLKSNQDKKASQKSLIKYGVIGLCIIAVVFILVAPCVKYAAADVSKAIGLYHPAASLYFRLGDYKDSEEKLNESRYLYGEQLESKGDYLTAEKQFIAAGNYKDSAMKTVEAQKQLIKEKQISNTVTIGNCRWTIIDKKNNQVLLMKKVALKGLTYNDSLGNVTWESSSIRKYLNSKFLTSTFTEAERKNIILSDTKNNDNETYCTDGGNDTKDLIFCLSIAEANSYHAVFPKFKTNTWLRSPGSSPNSAAYLSTKGTVMDFGYAVNSTDFTVRPVFWYGLD